MKINRNKIKAVVFDWAGTTVDYGCRAPLAVFLEIFKKRGIPITVEEASKPMGMLKIDHIRELFKDERIRNEYAKKYNKQPDETTILEFYKEFEPALFKILPEYAEPIPYVLETIEKLRKKYDLKIGSTTGYTRDMMNIVTPIAEKKGYKPDYMITSSDVKQGRPYPWMMFHNAMNLGVFPMHNIIKVGDTVADIQEGRNAGCWSVGLIEGSSSMGYTKEEFDKINNNKSNENVNSIRKRVEEVKTLYNKNGADYILKTMKELPDTIEAINERMNRGEFPANNVHIPSQPYLLFTAGPITTSTSVKLPMMTDWGSREQDYLDLVQNVRSELVNIAVNDDKKVSEQYTSVIMQGSGTFGVESCIGSVVPKDGKLLVLTNGAYGTRLSKIAKILNIDTVSLEFDENEVPCVDKLEETLKKDNKITHVAYIHSETTTGILNPIEKINKMIKKHNKISIVDAMSSFGSVPINIHEIGVDFIIASSNKNIQGVPGFSFVVAKRSEMDKCKSNVCKSLSLDLYDQWNYLEKNKGGFRFTSPVHSIRAFDQAIKELRAEGGVNARYKRYCEMQKTLTDGMIKLGFKPIDLKGYQGPVITTFYSPNNKNYNFDKFYEMLKDRKCVIYPGKLTKADTFRIGTLGDISVRDVQFLLEMVKESMFWENNTN